MSTNIYWINGPIPGKLAVAVRPRSGEWLEDELAGWKKEGVHLVVSLLEAKEAEALHLEKEATLCEKYSIGFISHPVPDHGVPPSAEETAALAQSLKAPLQNGKKIVIHGRSGIGRPAVIAACVLLGFGIDPKRALALVASARGFMVPETKAQREWVEAFAAPQ